MKLRRTKMVPIFGANLYFRVNMGFSDEDRRTEQTFGKSCEKLVQRQNEAAILSNIIKFG